MSYLVFCTFDLKGATPQNYLTAYSDLAALGLHKIQKATSGNDVVIPTTSVMGSFNGTSIASVRDDMRNRVQAAFRARGFKSEIFLVAANDWAWGAGTT